MWKLVLIDDDHIILRGLSRNIPWEEYGFEVSASAHDGEEGLDAVERERPHVVITDIRMPFMDGLQLTEAIKSKFPDVKIILMTSYDEFEFAQKALKLKVFDFVLKPVENDKLLEVALRAAAEWEQERVLAKKVLEGVPFLRQRFYENLLRGKYRQEEIEHELAFLELPLKAERYAVLLIIADDYYETGAGNRFGQELLKYCIHNISLEVLDSLGEGVVFELGEDEIAVICTGSADQQAMERKVMQMAEHIRYNAEVYLKTTVTVGTGPVCSELTGIAQSYHEAKAATDFRHIAGTNQVLSFRDTRVKQHVSGHPAVNGGWEADLGMNIRLGFVQEALLVLEHMEKQIQSAPITLERLRLLGIEIVLVIVNTFQSWSEPPYDRERVEELLQELPKIRTAKDIFQNLRALIRDAAAGVNDSRSTQQKRQVDQAVDYILKNYMKEGLALQDVADQVHLSTSYFSMIFKKQTGTTFSEFLQDVRMKKAVELLRGEEMRTYEVASRVGYTNPRHFSVLFKRHTGKTPSEFKQLP
ncbi:response regulator [Paenibacillus sonchi]|uniref:response regulator n=1 Tax=Paenibacillus sonchi TaxID=373687 RepID=UPI001E48B1B8|nr:response regulator [Paenibacillus sonchi]MCE3201628.1 response regulator [Paenibacillus sonchi]